MFWLSAPFVENLYITWLLLPPPCSNVLGLLRCCPPCSESLTFSPNKVTLTFKLRLIFSWHLLLHHLTILLYLFTNIRKIVIWNSHNGKQYVYMCAKLLQSCLILFDPMNISLSGSPVNGILQAIILEWVAISFSRGPSQPKDQSHIS